MQTSAKSFIIVLTLNSNLFIALILNKCGHEVFGVAAV